jgi:Carbohydrate binding module (family 6).
LTAPATGGWQRWTTVSANVTLRAGVQTLRLRTITTPGGYNVNWIRISPCSRALVGEVPGRADPAADAFVRAFRDQDPYADLAEPIGELDYADVAEFLRRIWGGCE